MKKEYRELEMELVHFDYGTEVHTCEFVEACPGHGCAEVAVCPHGPVICEFEPPFICKCDGDIIHASTK